MTVTVLCQVVDRIGSAAWYWTGTYGGRHMERCEAHPAANFVDTQPGTIPVELRHDGKILGHVDYLEHAVENTDLRAVATLDIDPDLADMVTGLFCSADVSGRRPLGSATVEDLTLNALALVDETAGVCARRVSAFPGDYRNSWERQRWSRPPRILERAAAAARTEYRYRRPKELRIVRPAEFEARCDAGLEPLPVINRGRHVAEWVDNDGRPLPVNTRNGRRPYVRPTPTRVIPGIGPIEYSVPTGYVIGVR